MRIAHVTSFRPVSTNGVHVAASRLAQAQAKLGVSAEVWHFRRDREDVVTWIHDSGVKVVELPYPPWVDQPVVSWARRMPSTSREWIAGHIADVDGFHFHSVFQPECWWIARLDRRPFCISPHGGYAMLLRSSLRNAIKRPLWTAFESPMVRDAKFVHALSAGDASAIRTVAPAAVVEVVANGVDVPEVAPPAAVDGSPWLFIGRLDVRTKGLDILLEGYELASRSAALPRMAICGPDFRGGREELVRRVRRLGLEGQVGIRDAVSADERRDLLAACSMFVQASRNEGLPLAPLEAMAAGRCVAVTPGTNLAETVREAGAGFAIREASPAAVAETLVEAAGVGDTGLAEAGSRAWKLVQSGFRWDRAAERIATLYEEYFDVG